MEDKLKKISRLESDSDLIIFEEIERTAKTVETLESEIIGSLKDATEEIVDKLPTQKLPEVFDVTINGIQVLTLKGDKGDPGRDGRDGVDGKPGKNADETFVIQEITKKIPKPRDGINGRDGKDGLSGIDGSPDTGEQIVDKINALPTNKDSAKIDVSHIKGLPSTQQIFTAIRSGTGSGTPAGVLGDIQINNPLGSFGTVGGARLGTTGNTRGTDALDLQSQRTLVTQVASGDNATAIGSLNIASGLRATAVGFSNTAAGQVSTAIGYGSSTGSSYTTAVGYGNSVGGSEGSGLGFANSASSNFTSAVGHNNSASGDWASSIGANNSASGLYSTALGYSNQAQSNSSTAVGYSNFTLSDFQGGTAVGNTNTASGIFSTALGVLNQATEQNTIAVGGENTASALFSSAFGFGNYAQAVNSLVVGRSSFSNTTGLASVVLGVMNNQTGATLDSGTGEITGTPAADTVGKLSTAVGITNLSSGEQSATFGYKNTAADLHSLAIGYFNTADDPADVGENSAFGNQNTASGSYSSAFGYTNTISSYGDKGSAFGYSNSVSSESGSAFGYANTASGSSADSAFGYSNTASGGGSIAVGVSAVASGNNSTSFGNNTTASGDFSVALGRSVNNSTASTLEMGATDAGKLVMNSTGRVSVRAGASSGTIARVGGVIFDHFADAGNVGTGDDDLYSDTLPASTFNTNGDKVSAMYQGIFVGAAASTQRLRVYCAGTNIYDSGALAIGVATNNWTLRVEVIRESSSVLRCSVSVSTDFATLFPYSAYTRITGLTLTNTQVLKVTGEAAGAGAANDQIVAKFGYVEWKSAA